MISHFVKHFTVIEKILQKINADNANNEALSRRETNNHSSFHTQTS